MEEIDRIKSERKQSTALSHPAPLESTSIPRGKPVLSAPRSMSGWPSSLVIFSLGSAILLWLFRAELGAAVRVWRDSETFGHAFFIFPIVVFLLFRLRNRLGAIQPMAFAWILLPIAILTFIWLLGRLTSLTVVQQLAFIAIWQCFFLLVFGWSVTRQAIFPLAYLYMAVPFGLSVIPLLQDITAQIVVRLLRLTGVPVFLDGYHIEIPDGSFLIAEACSGVRYLIVCVALGILAAYLFFHSWKRRLLFVALSLIVPIIANGIRAYGIVMIAHLSHYTLAVDVDHVVYGFIFLSLVTICLLGLGALLREHTPYRPPIAEMAGGRRDPGESCPLPRLILCAGAAVTLVILVQYRAAIAVAPPVDRDVMLQAPNVEEPWRLLGDASGPWTPDFHGADAQSQHLYRGPKGDVQLFVAYYQYQRDGAEAVSDLNALAREGSAWKLLGVRRNSVEIGEGSLPINQVLLGHQDQTLLVWYWYWIDGEVTSSRIRGKLLEAKALLTGGERDAAIVAVSTKVAENVEGAAAVLHDFLQQRANQGGLAIRFDSQTPGSSGDLRPLNLVGGSVAQ